MKKIFIIYGHYDDKSFNASIKNTFIDTAKENGHTTTISLLGDRLTDDAKKAILGQKVGAVVSKLKTFRKIEPYKGKGVREKGQYILKKEGKKK